MKRNKKNTSKSIPRMLRTISMENFLVIYILGGFFARIVDNGRCG